MADAGHAPLKLPRWMGPLHSRPRLLGGVAAGVGVAILLALVPNGLRLGTRAILSWDAGAITFILLITHLMRRCSGPDQLRREAAQQDEGQHFILATVLIAATASLGAIAAELSLAKGEHGLEKAIRVALAFGTVALSWFVVQVIFALHYAHEFYAPEMPNVDKDGNGVAGGLGFPGDEEPDYWDFVHFAVVIGVAAQTADVTFKSKTLRRIGTLHSVVAFTFNTVVLALTINLLAGLF